MARIRTIKPEFFTSEQIVECSTSARLLFIGIWCFSDDGGVHPASVKRLKMEVFPGDAITDDEIQVLIDELIQQGLVTEFQADSQHFWHVTGWSRHQKIDRPTLRHPQPNGANSTSIRRDLDEHSTSPRDGDETNGTETRRTETNGTESKGDESKGTERTKSPCRDLEKITKEVIKDNSKLMAWFDGSNLDDTEENRIWCIAAAECALKFGKNPAALFNSLIKELRAGDTEKLEAYRDAAKLRLRSWKVSSYGVTIDHPKTIAEALEQ